MARGLVRTSMCGVSMSMDMPDGSTTGLFAESGYTDQPDRSKN